MEAQLHRTHDPHSKESLNPVVDDSPAVRCGLVEPTVMEKPVLAEDLYATRSDVVGPPVRSFAKTDEEKRGGELEPPPLSTGIYETQLPDPLSQIGHPGYDQDLNREQQMGDIGKLIAMEEDPLTPIPTMEVSPATHRSKVTDPTNTGGKEAGITDVLRSFDKMKVYDQPESKTLKSDRNEQTGYTGSHDQFAPEPVQSPPPDTPDTIAGDPSSQSSSYTGKITSATSALAGKALTAKDIISSKLGLSGESKTESERPNKKSSLTTDYAHKVADTLSGTLGPVYERVVGGESSVIARMRGCGHEENTECTPLTKIVREPESKGSVGVKEYLVDTFTPGDDDKVLSDAITQAFHLRKQPKDSDPTTNVVGEGERRLHDSGK